MKCIRRLSWRWAECWNKLITLMLSVTNQSDKYEHSRATHKNSTLVLALLPRNLCRVWMVICKMFVRESRKIQRNKTWRPGKFLGLSERPRIWKCYQVSKWRWGAVFLTLTKLLIEHPKGRWMGSFSVTHPLSKSSWKATSSIPPVWETKRTGETI